MAFFTETYLPNIDGVVTSIVRTKNELERRGCNLVILTAGERRRTARPDGNGKNGTPVHYFKSLPFPPYPTYKIALFPQREAEGIVRSFRPDVIHTHGMGPMGVVALLTARRLKKRIIGTLHTNIQEATHYISRFKIVQGVAKKVAWRYLRWYFNQCDAVIAPSDYMKKECERHGIRNVHAIPNGIDTGYFKPGKRTIWKDRTVALNVGRIVKEKNLDVLIKAAKGIQREVPNILFVVVGSGPAEGYYEKLVKKHGIESLFTFVSGVQPDGVLTFYQNADVFVFPSMFETQGVSGIEALACGLPVAGADYLAIPDFVKNGKTGYLFRPKSVNECTRAVVKAIRNRKRMRNNAIRFAKRYELKANVTELVELYGSVTGKR